MDSLKGKLLIAAPDLLDPNFVKSVVLMVQHDQESGALGLILNRATELTVKAAWEQVSQTPCGAEGLIFQGGPVQGPLMVLHSRPDASQIEVVEGVHFVADPEKVEWLIEQGIEPAKFLVGYAGWSPGQLESELASESWIVGNADSDLVFLSGEDLWDRLIVVHKWASLGVRSIQPRLIPMDPTLN